MSRIRHSLSESQCSRHPRSLLTFMPHVSPNCITCLASFAPLLYLHATKLVYSIAFLLSFSIIKSHEWQHFVHSLHIVQSVYVHQAGLPTSIFFHLYLPKSSSSIIAHPHFPLFFLTTHDPLHHKHVLTRHCVDHSIISHPSTIS